MQKLRAALVRRCSRGGRCSSHGGGDVNEKRFCFLMRNSVASERTKLSIKIEGLVTETDADALGTSEHDGVQERETGLGRESSWETKLELLTRIELARMDRASD